MAHQNIPRSLSRICIPRHHLDPLNATLGDWYLKIWDFEMQLILHTPRSWIQEVNQLWIKIIGEKCSWTCTDFHHYSYSSTMLQLCSYNVKYLSSWYYKWAWKYSRYTWGCAWHAFKYCEHLWSLVFKGWPGTSSPRNIKDCYINQIIQIQRWFWRPLMNWFWLSLTECYVCL